MGRLFYTLLFYMAMPLVLLRLVYRAWKAPAYAARWHERFGFFSMPVLRDPIWVHAVSVGETIAAVPMINALRVRYPERDIVVTTMTPTGSERVRAMLGDEVFHVYAPYDVPGAIRRFIKRIRPRMLIVMETELWPNTVSACRRAGIPVLLANARLSERSARGYGRVSWLSRPLFSQLNQVVAQHEDDAQRFRELGCLAENVEVSGSIKFDIQIDDGLRQQGEMLRTELGLHRPIWIAASTHAGEDEQVLQAHRQVLESQPDALLVLVPRHPERFSPVFELADRAFVTSRRSTDSLPLATDVQVYVADTMGELLKLYAAADVAFVGGSLIERGGHNPLEPAALSLPIIMGPHVFNFEAICHALCEAGGLKFVGSSTLLAERVIEFFTDADYRAGVGAQALQVVESNRGALGRLLTAIERHL